MEIPTKEILLILLGGGLITAVIGFIKFAWDKTDDYRRLNRERAKVHLTETTEHLRLENEFKLKSSENYAVEIWKLYNETREEIKRLRIEISELTRSNSLSNQTVTRFYTQLRRVQRQMGIIENIVARTGGCEDVQVQTEILRQELDELVKQLP